MRVAITGAAGLFGHGLVAAFSSRHTVFPLTGLMPISRTPSRCVRLWRESNQS